MAVYAPLSTNLTYQEHIRRSKWSQCSFLSLCFAFPVTLIYLNSRLNSVDVDSKINDWYTNKSTLRTDLKYILLWTRADFSPFDYFGKGQESFIKNNCTFTNCFITSDKQLFGGDITKFDAIAFNGRNLFSTEFKPPRARSPHQKYIFVNMESSDNEPFCKPLFDGFFNWTCTYKLNSDIVYPYIYIRDRMGKHVGPKVNMEWVTDMDEVDRDFKEKLIRKSKAAAWFVSHCKTRSKREVYVKCLQKALEPHGMKVDVYGRCGPLACKRSKETVCNAKLASDYYFYLSFENSFAEDYITEKLLTAFNNDAVPIVYGGSNYSRFLPPGSYIDARKYTPEKLASLMIDIMINSTRYHEFFRWRNHYSYSKSENVEDVCNVCAAMNDESKLKPSLYENFRSWWNPEWKERCQQKSKSKSKPTAIPTTTSSSASKSITMSKSKLKLE